MNKKELYDFIAKTLTRQLGKFDAKNMSYGSTIDPFYNFREGARRLFGSDEPSWEQMFDYLWALTDKHNIAISLNGLELPDIKDRLEDVIVYAAIGLAMAEEKEREERANV